MTKEEARKEAQAIFDARIGAFDWRESVAERTEYDIVVAMKEGLDLDPDVEWELDLMCAMRWEEWVKAYEDEFKAAAGRVVYRVYERHDRSAFVQDDTLYLGTDYDVARLTAISADDHLTVREKHDGSSVGILWTTLFDDEAEAFANADKAGKEDIWCDVTERLDTASRSAAFPRDAWNWRR